MNKPSYLDYLEDLSNDDLALYGLEADEEYDRIRKVRDQLNGEVLRRLVNYDRAMDSWGDVAVFREQSWGAYEWDVESLWPLLNENLHPAQIAECVTVIDVPAHTETTVNTLPLKRYAAKLGDVGQRMLACATRRPGAPRVRYERIQALEETLAASVAALKEKK